MNSITKCAISGNMGGNSCLQIVEDDQVMNIVPIGNDKFKVVMHGLADFAYIYSTIDTISVQEQLKQDQDGEHCEVAIKGFIPDSALVTEESLDSLGLNKWVVSALDNDGKKRVYGMPDEGLAFSYVYDPGKEPKDAKGYTFSFAGKQRKRSKRL